MNIKINKLFASFLVGCGFAATLVSCSDDNDPTYLDNLRVSSSYVAINQNGGSTSIELNATESWSVDAESVPAWLTISPAQGGAGQTSVSFSAESSLDGRTAEVLLNCGGKTQRINVIQGLATVSPATCAEVIAGPDSKTYRVTGTVKSIANTTYGNWYLVDETGEVYIYGTLDKKGAEKNFLSLGIDVGDVVTVEGPKTTYNGTVELVNVTVLSIKKSLIKIESGGEAAFDANGGDFMVQLTVAGDGPYIDIDDAGKSWVGITSIEKTDTTTNVSFHVAANQEESARSANIAVSAAGRTGNGDGRATAAARAARLRAGSTLLRRQALAKRGTDRPGRSAAGGQPDRRSAGGDAGELAASGYAMARHPDGKPLAASTGDAAADPAAGNKQKDHG